MEGVVVLMEWCTHERGRGKQERESLYLRSHSLKEESKTQI